MTRTKKRLSLECKRCHYRWMTLPSKRPTPPDLCANPDCRSSQWDKAPTRTDTKPSTPRLPRVIRRSPLYLGIRDLYTAEKALLETDGVTTAALIKDSLVNVLCMFMHYCDSRRVTWQDVVDAALYQRAVDLIEEKDVVMFGEELEAA